MCRMYSPVVNFNAAQHTICSTYYVLPVFTYCWSQLAEIWCSDFSVCTWKKKVFEVPFWSVLPTLTPGAKLPDSPCGNQSLQAQWQLHCNNFFEDAGVRFFHLKSFLLETQGKTDGGHIISFDTFSLVRKIYECFLLEVGA